MVEDTGLDGRGVSSLGAKRENGAHADADAHLGAARNVQDR